MEANRGRCRSRLPAEVTHQKFPYPAVRIVSRVGIVFNPMVEELSAGVEVGMIEIVVSAWIGDEFNRRSSASPVRNLSRAILGGRPIV
jgi:hypothetical protein